jgi:hypothetical protein
MITAVRCGRMTRTSWVIAGAAGGVAVVLLVGAWLLLGGRDAVQAGTTRPDVAATTVLSWPPDPSDGSKPPEPYPTVPSERVRGEHVGVSTVRTDGGGRRLLVQLMETDCSGEEVRLLGEHPDRVEVEVRTVLKPPPPSVSIGPDGSYGCMGIGVSDGPYAVIELREPLGDRAVVVHRAS